MLNDSHINFSPTLAATIGLEETILLTVLTNAQQWLNSTPTCCVFEPQLTEQLPFWQANDVQRIALNLVNKGVIQLHSAPYMQSLRLEFTLVDATPAHSVPSTSAQSTPTQTIAHRSAPYQPAMNTPSQTTPMTPPHAQGANLIPGNWQPDDSSLALLAQHQIPASFIQEQAKDFVLYWRERGEVSHAWNSRFVKQTQRNWQKHQASTAFSPASPQPHAMDSTWTPSQDALDILQRVDIPLDFIQDSVPEFILYWQEKGTVGRSWNSFFVKHIKRQWASYTTTLQYDTEPKLISKEWQPSNDAIEVLQLANIDRDFALREVPSFVLFWLETKQAHNSWNSKFIQHAKYQWAKRHHIHTEYAHERHQSNAGSHLTKDPDFIRRHSDQSWADGLY